MTRRPVVRPKPRPSFSWGVRLFTEFAAGGSGIVPFGVGVREEDEVGVPDKETRQGVDVLVIEGT